ncbi:methyl-accepting chemotaxis protein [Pseudomonas sp. hsmgli-8]|uniref:Methyl-accepting chemotaxis protein n=2 Tax=Pseudomonas TaxID=286 RepID=A0ABX0Y8Y2_9PSED|nr:MULTISPECIES: methyl-accepting chemotaxis protein [Pseudomonas]MBF7141214.1 methyl-accepting chemotaxis protein [Pseudomonas sp. LY10J]NJO99749.1 methyl-accepting chemotaxis protein [Pseudomonas quercus]
MALIPTRIAGRMTFGILALLVLTAVAIYGVMAIGGKPRLIAAGTEAAEQSASAITRQLALQLSRIEGTTAALAHLAQSLPHDEALVKANLPGVIDSQGDRAIAGGGLWPEPGLFTPQVQRRSFFWARNASNGLDFSEEYNSPQAAPYQAEAWYTGARTAPAGRCVWSDAYQDPVSGVAMTTCSVPYQVQGAFAGVTTLDLKLDGLADFLGTQGNVTGGYAFAVDRAGNVLFFPDAKADKAGLPTLAGLAKTSGWLQPVVDHLANQGTQTTTLYVNHDGRLGGPAYVTLQTMDGTGWRIGLITPQARVVGLADAITQQLMLFLLPLLAILLGLAWLAGRRLLAQLEETTVQIERLGEGSQGGAELDIRRADELGALRAAVNKYAGSLRQMLKRIADESVSLESQANSLAQLSHGLADRAEAQREDNTLLAAAVTEMSASANEVARNTSDCSETAKRSLLDAQGGQHQVQRNSESIQVLAGDINSAASAITRLGTDIERVGSVLDVIKSISEQTNLLALNAAIEAARAGEQGRGFAVVADEVRTLAGRAQTSANEIQEMMTQLRQASIMAVSTMQRGAERTQEAVHQATGVSATLGTTVNSFDDIVQRAQQIAVAAQQQSHVTHEINELAVRIHTASEEGARDASALRELGQGMQAISSRLGGLSRGR